MNRNLLTVAALLIASASCGASEATLNLTPEQWRKDVRHFIKELPKRHVNPFEFTSRSEWLSEAASLERNLASMNGDQVYVALSRLAKRIGDLHTQVLMPPDSAQLPIRVRHFGDEHRIVGVVSGYERALGARLVSIDGMQMPDVLAKLRQLTPVGETETLARSQLARLLSVGMLLHGSGITRQRSRATLGLIGDTGQEFTIDIQAADLSPKAEWKYAFPLEPLWLSNRKEPFWFVWLPERKMIYASFRGYDNLSSGGRAMLAAVVQHRPEKLVIDMRRNGGGDYTDGLEHLVEPIRTSPAVNRRNHLFVLVGPDTYSAAMANTAHFRERTEAILVGETLGERPNSNQEPRQFRLPASRLIVTYSTRRYQFTTAPENVIRPDHEVPLTWEAYRQGRDPVLEWVERFGAQ